MKQQFINQTDQSNKFWHIETISNRLLVHYGKVGTKGQQQEKTFADAAACEKEARKLIGEKQRKGYVALAEGSPVPDKQPANPVSRRLAHYLKLGLMSKEDILEQVDVDTDDAGYALGDLGEFDLDEFLDSFEDYNGFGEWLKQEFNVQLQRQRQMEQQFPAVTDFDKLNRAFRALRQQGIVALHFAGDTVSDGMTEVDENREDDSVGYCFYHGQGVGEIDEPFGLYLYFGSLPEGDSPEVEAADAAIGHRIVAALTAQGLQVEWSGHPRAGIEVVGMNWQKRFDDDSWRYTLPEDSTDPPTGVTVAFEEVESPYPFPDSAHRGSFRLENHTAQPQTVTGYVVQFRATLAGKDVLLQADDSGQHSHFQPVTDGMFLFMTKKHGVCIEPLYLLDCPLTLAPAQSLTVPFYLLDVDLAEALSSYGISDAAAARQAGCSLRLSVEVQLAGHDEPLHSEQPIDLA